MVICLKSLGAQFSQNVWPLFSGPFGKYLFFLPGVLVATNPSWGNRSLPAFCCAGVRKLPGSIRLELDLQVVLSSNTVKIETT